ncbi:AfsR/SARP family transcriptional regulator [Streptomyces thermolilacinus]|uniref:SARP family transcriptional regulator n=1 Tax=Streptomyces thermolilacinus SPC6 TaxID=1306406 RepID=A0A1D3DZS5_9ACTN|nr:BTAD domain-containing putative transcriptional regulator [Streptomyces thermolilacinus]OEJ97827.1 SARP family transcriptional regulator [Streptomyces thermolilacinus SPC6]
MASQEPAGNAADASGDLRIDLLGPVRARRGDTPLALGPVRRQAVLAALVLRAPSLVAHRQLLADIWGTRPPGTGHQVLPSYVYALRKALDTASGGTDRSVIHSRPGGYRFVPGAARTDLAALADLAARARGAKDSGDLDAALEHGARALELFRGEPLLGLPGPLADSERQRLARQRRTLHQDRAECLLSLGRYADALDELSAAPLAEPYDESLAALRMRALYGSGRQAEALAVYQEVRRRLLDELGVEPGEELRGVHQAVLRRDAPRLLGRSAEPGTAAAPAPRGVRRDEPPPGRARSGRSGHPHGAAPRRNELPGDIACLVGRERELALLTAPVSPAAVSVVAVDGTAGVGKTALVVRAAWALSAAYPDGCLFVDLRTHGAAHESGGPERALRRLLRTVHGDGDTFPDGPEDVEELVTAWRAATSALRLLLVVDDARGAEQVRPLLPAGPGSRVLVTSRQRLPGLDADVRLTVEPLGTGDAVRLLRELLGESRADREPDAALELARRCGGLPLALRIASARLQNRPAWTLALLAGRMADDVRGLGELRAEDRSVEAAFRMSYDRLTPGLRRGFRALGMAPTAGIDGLTLAAMLGGSREDAEVLLEDLVDASLLQQPRPGRYALHDLVRAHARRLAAETPGQAAADRAAVLRLYTAACRAAGDWGPEAFPTGPGDTGSPFPGWREASAWLEAAGGELVDVVSYAATTGHPDHACWIAEALVDHLVRLGRYHEGRAALNLALPCAELADDQRMPASLRNCLGMIDLYQGRPGPARTRFTEALHHSRSGGGPRERARATAGLGIATWMLGGIEDGIVHLDEAVELAAGLDDAWLTGVATCSLGAVRSQQGLHERAFAHHAAALAVAEKSGRPRTISNVLCFFADTHLAVGQYEEAEVLLRRAAELARHAEDLPLHAASLSRLATVEQIQDRTHSAVATHHQALATLTRHTSVWLEMEVRIRLGNTYAAAGRSAEARREFQAALSLPGAGDYPRQFELARARLSGFG